MPGSLVPGMYALGAETGGANRSSVRWLTRAAVWVGGNVTRLILTSGSGMGLARTERTDVVLTSACGD
jgi:hypothetical protein